MKDDLVLVSLVLAVGFIGAGLGYYAGKDTGRTAGMAEKEKEWQAAIEQLSCPACPTAAATVQQEIAVPSTAPTVPAQAAAAEPTQVADPAPVPLIAAAEDPPPAEDPESDDPNRLVPPEVAKYLPNMV